MRLILGTVFIVSGFTKAVDPWGGLYKISEYFAGWGIYWSNEIYLILACGLASFEFVVGVLLFLGCYRKSISYIAVGFMSLMTLLTLYIWIYDPVSDCGCFGDAFIISNSLTFWKNVVLLIITVLLLKLNDKAKYLVRPKIQWLVVVVTGVYIFAIQAYGYNIQPLVDFRPFPVGANLSELLSSESEGDFQYVYEKDGERKVFDIANLPDSTWTFVERSTPQAATAEISVFDSDGDDVTSDVILSDGKQILLVESSPRSVGLSRNESIRRVNETALRHDIDFIAILAGMDAKSDALDNDVEKYFAEDTDLKMLVRGDAALVFVNDGIITRKINLFALAPDFPETFDELDGMFAVENDRVLLKFSLIWLTALLVIYILSRNLTRFGEHKIKKSKKISNKKD